MRDDTDDQGHLADALRRCASGDQTALCAIFESEGARLVAVARRILRRGDLAEEAVQEGFVRIWTHAGTYAPDRGSARGWIYAIVRNQAINMLRRADRETPHEDVENLALSAPTPEAMTATVEALDARSSLRRCLALLDEDKRACVLLAYLYGFTHGEIAGRLGVPLGTAKSWVRRGLSALRECLS